MQNAREVMPEALEYADDHFEAVKGADALASVPSGAFFKDLTLTNSKEEWKARSSLMGEIYSIHKEWSGEDSSTTASGAEKLPV